ncbi:nucleotidyltransferase family protein [uncultured Psychroserpens sp.]|uniref:nucleotidyltransferase family protein n=1 Tax=uncultured Psychroserpens sp. TaxID=255436 RepID=UPI002632B98E|nr:nucleotidyltransferase family protein [uncultured Psychroserpens sp.]
MLELKSTYKNTLQLIANILSFEHHVPDLKETLLNESFDEEALVKVASDHLVLTTVYCRLKQKQLLEFISKDLAYYLEDINTINTNRNLSLIEQSKAIARIFNAHNISYAFVKGSAFLIKNIYQDIGERMIGDIDILVKEDQIEHAFKLLKDQGYTRLPSSIKARFFEHKHLDRLALKDELAAVELHKYLLNSSKRHVLDTNNLLSRRQIINEVYILHEEDLFNHNILNFQINDKAHYYSKISMRSTYDTLVFIKLFPKLLKPTNSSYHTSYFSLNSVFFKEFIDVKLNRSRINAFESRLKSYRRHSFHQKKLHFFALIGELPSRLSTFIVSRPYRQAIYNDRHRIWSELKSKFIKP